MLNNNPRVDTRTLLDKMLAQRQRVEGVLEAAVDEVRGLEPAAPVAAPAARIDERREEIGRIFDLAPRLRLPDTFLSFNASLLVGHSAQLSELGDALDELTARLDPAAAHAAASVPARVLMGLKGGLDAKAENVHEQVDAALNALTQALTLPAGEITPARCAAITLWAEVFGLLGGRCSMESWVSTADTLLRSSDRQASAMARALWSALSALPKETPDPQRAVRTALSVVDQLARDDQRTPALIIADALKTLPAAKAADAEESVRLQQMVDTYFVIAAGEPADAQADALARVFSPAALQLANDEFLSNPARVVLSQVALAPLAPNLLTALEKCLVYVVGRAEYPGPTPETAQKLADAVVAALQSGLPPQALIDACERTSRGSSVASIVTGLTTLLNVARPVNAPPEWWEKGALVTLATQLAARPKTFKAQEPTRVLVQGLTRAVAFGDAERFEYFCRVLPKTAKFMADMEEGAAKRDLLASIAADVGTASTGGLDLKLLSVAFPCIPEESLPRMAALAVHQRLDADGWLSEVNDLFEKVSHDKNSVRSLRSLLVLGGTAGAPVVDLVHALAASGKNGRQLSKVVTALLLEHNQVQAHAIAQAVAELRGGADVVARIDGQKLAALKNNDDPKRHRPGEVVLSPAVTKWFADGNGRANPNAVLTGLLAAAKQGRYQDFRFTTPAAQRQLASLTEAQRRAWMRGSTMTHIRFAGQGEAAFAKRVRAAAALGQRLLALWTGHFGASGALTKHRDQLVQQLRRLDKNDQAARLPLAREVEALNAKLDALAFAERLSKVTPDGITPYRFMRLADGLEARRGQLGDDAFQGLLNLLRVDDLEYSEVTTDDASDPDTVMRLWGNTCLRWPDQANEILAYTVDANKRIIVTQTAGGELRRAVMRLVEQTGNQDRQPMLVLERAYPDAASDEEKQRIIEHAVRRAAGMGIPVAFPTEYYWKPSTTGRAKSIKDLDRLLNDLAKRYNARFDGQEVALQLRNVAGNMAYEYMDCAPPNGLAGVGRVGARRYEGQKDTMIHNKFIVMWPQE